MSRKHIAVFTIPGIGHINPLLQLANALADINGYRFTFFTSGCFIDIVKQKCTKGVLDHEWIGIDDEIPASSLDVEDQFVLIPVLYGQYPVGLKKMIDSQWFKDMNFDFAIVEHFTPGALECLQAINMPAYCFVTCGLAAVINLLGFQRLFEWAPDFVFTAAWRASQFAQNFLGGGFLPGDLSSMRPMMYANAYNIRNTQATIINSFDHLEGDGIKRLHSNPKYAHVKVIPVGPLATLQAAVKPAKVSAPLSAEAKKVQQFLDSHPPNSVIYLSLGSIARPNAEQLKEFYLALKKSNHPFIWSLDPKIRPRLPDSLLTHSESTGLILPWVPQQLILSHPSTAVFMTHAGWNGTMESITSGIPVVCFPQFGDQHDNSKLLERVGCAVVVPRTVLNGRVVPEEEIRGCVERVVGEGGEKYRAKMQQLRRGAEEAAREGGVAWNYIRSIGV
ncbi:hypothetical protein HK097_008196 [Rhizophlyctis rosea]|uniref:UDP-glucuronosyltransferase n=1 Tax=Rhizophlyctis rosea TaxID=64517 RepID=A0AAD5SIB8_9FUNG|nr:hypothetical protein HK097_008196 [Rhizophlyctis rosea]